MKTDQRPRLLIVDDDGGTAELLGRLLRNEGFDTEVELTGAAALRRLAHAPVFDALITDFHIPGADGLVIGTRARASRAGIPIFVVTGDPHSVGASLLLEDPVEVVTKPIDYQELVRQLHDAVAHYIVGTTTE
jgi:CheY-like chemotaxis protein